MAKRKKTKSSPKHVAHVHQGYAHDDRALMLLAGAAAIVVGFFAVFSYKSNATLALPSPTPMSTTISLDSQNKSVESGTATLTEMNGKVVVTLALTGFTKGISQPAHIHIGSCPNPGAVKFPLSSVVDGSSTTTLDLTLADLKALGKLAINVHKSVPQSSTYVSCGDLNL